MLLAVVLSSCPACSGRKEPAPRTDVYFNEYTKEGKLALFILGDYFPRYFIGELLQLARGLSTGGEPVFVCTDEYRDVLSRLLPANGIHNARFIVQPAGAPILNAWARDVAVAGRAGDERVVVVSPDKHAATRAEAEAPADVLRQVVGPGTAVRIAPFVFEGGNLAFVDTGARRVLFAGRKIVFDNEQYQNRPWADGLTGDALLSSMGRTFGVDSVVVIGRARTRPPSQLYFEHHLDMGMAVLKYGRAVVSRLDFAEEDRRAVARAVAEGGNVVAPYLDLGYQPEELADVIGERLVTVAGEYEDYAALLEGLGLTVYRSKVTWKHVLSAMSWSNVVQTRDRVFAPLYPDSARGVVLAVGTEGGQLTRTIDVSSLEDEVFLLEGDNKLNHALYGCLGYETVPVPEYLHYYTGGLHCFVNVLD